MEQEQGDFGGRIVEPMKVGDLNLDSSVDDYRKMEQESKHGKEKLVTFEEPAGKSRVEKQQEETYERRGPLLVGQPKGEVVTPGEEPKIEETPQKAPTCIFTKEQIYQFTTWSDPKKTAFFFTPTFFALAACCFLPILSVFFYSLFFCVIFGITLRFLLLMRGYLGKTDQCEVECCLQNLNLKIADEGALHQMVDFTIYHWNRYASTLQDVFTTKSLKQTLTAGFIFWLSACLTRHISTPALLLLALTALFTLPKFYQVYKQPIDKNLEMLKEKYNMVKAKVYGTLKKND